MTDEQHEQPQPVGAVSKPRSSPVRTGLAWLMLVLFCVLAPLGVVAGWARYSLFNTDRFVELVGPLADNKTIREAISVDIGDIAGVLATQANDKITAVENQVVSSIKDRVLGKDATPSASPVASGSADTEATPSGLPIPIELNTAAIKTKVQDAAITALATSQFADAWKDASKNLQKRLMDIENTSGPLAIDLSPVIPVIEKQLAKTNIPALTKIKIPAEKLRLELIDARRTEELRQGLRAVKLVGFWLPVLACVFALLVILVGPGRWRWAGRVGTGLTIAMVVLLFILVIGQRILLAEVKAGSPRAMTSALLEVVLQQPVILAMVFAVIGVLVGLGANAAVRRNSGT